MSGAHKRRAELQTARRLRRGWPARAIAPYGGPSERPQGRAPSAEAVTQAGTLIADRGYDSNWFRNELAARGIVSCIPGRKNRKQAIDYDKALYKQRHKVENMFAKLKDWRRIATRYDRCAHTFLSAINIAASIAFYLKE